MANYGTSYQQYDSKTMAKVVGTFLPISHKASREIARTIEGKSIDSAINYLQAVADKKQAVSFKRFNKDVPHRKGKGFGAGRFPKKASERIIELLKSLKANASDKELDAENLMIIHATAQRGSVLWHYGRWRGQRRKSTHFEAVAKEMEKKEKKKVEKLKKKEEPKPEVKKEEKPKVEVKKEKSEIKKEETKPAEKKVEKPIEKSTPKEEKKPETPKEEKIESKEIKSEEKPKKSEKPEEEDNK